MTKRIKIDDNKLDSIEKECSTSCQTTCQTTCSTSCSTSCRYYKQINNIKNFYKMGIDVLGSMVVLCSKCEDVTLMLSTGICSDDWEHCKECKQDFCGSCSQKSYTNDRQICNECNSCRK